MPPDNVLGAITLCWALGAVACLVISVPQSILLVRTSVNRDPLWWFRLKTTLLFGSLGVALIRNVAIWVDYTWFGQDLFGPIGERWPWDLAISALICGACVLAAVLYVQTQNEVRP